jgi:elongation of very long chain fatty acids protein 6
MKNRPSYDLKKALFLWNVALAVFSILGTISILPSLAATTYHFGFGYSVCKSHGVYTPHVGVWGFAFVISKIVEFGDTFFLVVRKRPIMFLHWYHHITVLMFSWYCLGQGVIGMGHWFSTVNYFVHSLMYTYYSIAAGGIRLPSGIAKAVTIIQLLQMVVGIIVNITICLYKDIYDFCEFDVKVLWFGVAIYSSYALLFGHYFYQRYMKRN